MCQWIHCYSLEEDDFFSIVKTFADVFPHIQLWCVNRFDFLLIGSDDAVRLPFATLSKRMHQEKVWTLLQQIHFDTEEEFLACFMSADSELRAKSKPARLHTDDNMLLEFSAPKALPNPKQQLRSTEFEADPEFVADLAHTTFDERSSIEARLDVAAAARAHTRCAFDRMGSKFEADHWLAARVLAPHQLWVAGIKREIDFAALSKLANAPPAPAQPSYVTRAFELAGAGEIDKAIAELEAAAVKLAAEGKPVFECIEAAVDILRRNGQLKDAMTTLDGVLQNGNMRENPLAAKLWAAKAGMLQDSAPKSSNAEEQGQIALAVARLAQTLAAKDAGGHDVVGRVLLKQKKFGQAFDEFHALCMNKADNSDFLLGLADALTGMGIDPMGSQSNPDAALKKLRYARRAAREVATLRDDPAAWARLAEIQLLLAFQDKPSAAYHSREALKAWHKVVELDKAGVLRKIGPDVLTAEDLKKARLDATLWQIGDTYKMEVNDFLKLHSTLSNLTAQ
jgi:tetratricopeptide (TPR) repeat protein